MTLLLAGFLAGLNACRKEGKDNDEPEPKPEAGKLQVSFPPGTISFSLVDSAVISLQPAGSAQPARIIMGRTNKWLQADLAGLANGNWTARLTIYTHSAATGSSIGMNYALTKELVVPADRDKGLNIDGPTGRVSHQWKPSVVIPNADRSVVLTVPLDLTDPLLDLQLADAGRWEYAYFEKNAYRKEGQTEHPVTGHFVECEGECLPAGTLANNRLAFAQMAEDIGRLPHNRGELFGMLLGKNSNDDLTFFYKYDID
ncbi:MAG: hypothetical protein P0Y53_25190 [Candidatus Pseudobacter hemicellulosilyticus]|uniref:Uncharacterized protein n=1 Tax=Candidatus Pseudobacter hemicellulosilyticus TaxID=3121375 RepID=A0AAJ6BFL6_9BACT|nr:MAG: hypothetical protein P0Y53_25190 [Pseudobacter sp.]